MGAVSTNSGAGRAPMERRSAPSDSLFRMLTKNSPSIKQGERREFVHKNFSQSFQANEWSREEP
jgi:hypothetical protein